MKTKNISYKRVLDIQKKFFVDEDKKNYDIYMIKQLRCRNFEEDVYTVGYVPSPQTEDAFCSKRIDEHLKIWLPNKVLQFIRKNKVVLAGGIFSKIMNNYKKVVDYDLFIVGGDHNKIIIDLINCFDRCEIIYGVNAITINDIAVKVQIVLRYYSSISEVLHGFDLGSACVAWDGNKYYATAMGIFAFHYSLNIFDVSLRSGTYEKRINKYIRRGFGIILPHLKINRCFRTLSGTFVNLGICVLEICRIDGKQLLGSFKSLPKSGVDYAAHRFLSYVKSSEHYSHSNWELFKRWDQESNEKELKKKYINNLEKNGFSINKSNPTTQKFGMVDPSNMTDREWYGQNYDAA